jgi:protein O-GlcNAc transferase
MARLVDLINAGRFAELEPEARELVRRYPTSGLAWQILGIALSRQGKDALEALRTASRLLPNDAAAQVNVGNALGRLGRLDEAVASYRAALTLSPDFAEAHQNLGHALLDLGRADDAAASCRRALELNPGSAAAQETLGNAFLLLGRLEDAAASYRRALEIEPEFRRGALRLRHRAAASGAHRRSTGELPQGARH